MSLLPWPEKNPFGEGSSDLVGSINRRMGREISLDWWFGGFDGLLESELFVGLALYVYIYNEQTNPFVYLCCLGPFSSF